MKAANYSASLATSDARPHSRWAAYLIFTVFASLYLFPFMRTLLIHLDEGSFLCGAQRIVHGQVFARDFLEIVGPGSFYWMAAFFKLFGATFLAGRLALFIPSLGTAVTLYYLSRTVCMRYSLLPCILLVGPYFGLLGQVESHHIDSNFFALLAVACMVVWQKRRSNSLAFAAGALAGVCSCIHQSKGVFLLLALLVWFLLTRRTIKSPLLLMSLTASGFLGVIGFVLTYFWSQGALPSIVYANYTLPSKSYAAANSVPYAQGIAEIWAFFSTHPSGSLWSAALAVIMTLPFAFVDALPAVLALQAARYNWRLITPEVTLCWLCGWAIWLSEIHRRDNHHLAYGSPLLIVLCIYMLGLSQKKTVSVAVRFLSVCCVCLAIFNCIVAAEIPAVSTTVGPAAIFGAGGVSVLNFLKEHIRPGEDIFVYPCSSSYYFLSSATNPTPYGCLYYGQNIPSQFQSVIDTLERRQVRYVVWDTVLLPRLEKERLMPGAMPKDSSRLIMEPYLKSHYTPVRDESGTLIMERDGK